MSDLHSHIACCRVLLPQRMGDERGEVWRGGHGGARWKQLNLASRVFWRRRNCSISDKNDEYKNLLKFLHVCELMILSRSPLSLIDAKCLVFLSPIVSLILALPCLA